MYRLASKQSSLRSPHKECVDNTISKNDLEFLVIHSLESDSVLEAAEDVDLLHNGVVAHRVAPLPDQ